ncbi:MAG: hypothetical protein R3F38_03410 [Gammaproteobacteria bacterium]
MTSPDKYANALPVGTRLDGTEKDQYEILGVLGVGGFGITYKARDNLLHSFVAIKEYLPTDFAAARSRWHPGDSVPASLPNSSTGASATFWRKPAPSSVSANSTSCGWKVFCSATAPPTW